MGFNMRKLLKNPFKKESNGVVPIFFSVDDRFVPYLVVTLTSIYENINQNNKYDIHILYVDLKEKNKISIKKLEKNNFRITFDDVTDYLLAISDKLPVRDYYSKTTYFRLFIAELYPNLNKVIYLDSDIVVLKDIKDLYDIDIKDNLLGAVNDTIMRLEECQLYVEKALGISHFNYFNAGVLLINTKQFREKNILNRFLKLLSYYNFVIAQDQDYLNVICKDHVLILDESWDIETCLDTSLDPKDFKIIHYNMATKPWHYKDCPLGEYFWKYAAKTEFHEFLLNQLAAYSQEEKIKDSKVVPYILKACKEEAFSGHNYIDKLNSKRNKDRVEIQKHIEELEKQGKFDVDVEHDPPSRTLMPDEVDYLTKKLSSKFLTWFSFSLARIYLKKIIKKKKIIISGFEGIENVQSLNSGAIITCNHFSPIDSFAIQIAYEELNPKKNIFKKRKFYRVIKEGNFTSFPGFYGLLMRHCNTLPLSSNFKTLKKFISSTDYLLKKGHLVLFYPEQSMWMNYRKPKPLKKGAYTFASKNDVPVIPVFITMKDSIEYSDNNYPAQEYTIHFAKPIYPKKELSDSENATYMMKENYRIWKETYERVYQRPLVYTTSKEIIEKDEILSHYYS